MNLTARQHHEALADRQNPFLVLCVAGGCAPVATSLGEPPLAACVASGGAPGWELRVQLGTGPQSMERGLKSENGRMACIPCPLVRMTISADWSPLS
jgi:hypothetical protein